MNEETPTNEPTNDTPKSTILIVRGVDFDERGSFKSNRARKRLFNAWREAANIHDALIDDLNALDAAVTRDPDNADLIAQRMDVRRKFETAKLQVEAAREALEDFYIARATTNDGTSVEDALEDATASQIWSMAMLDGGVSVIPKATTAS